VTATLPARWYTDPAVLEAEQEAIFRGAWQYAGRAEQVAEPGTYLTADLGRIPVLVVRDEEGELRGFVNVCRHRAHQVMTGTGRCTTLQCPYHAWTSGLDGMLRKAPRGDDEPGFSIEGLGLVRVAVDCWGPLLFVRPSAEGPTLAEALGELPGVVAASGLRMDALRWVRRVPWSLDANWKVAIENYLECYHCPTAHPGLAKLIDARADSYELHEHERFSFQVGPARDGRPPGSFVDGGDIPRAQWHWAWPNLTVNVEPGAQNLSVDAWFPAGPDRTEGVTDYFFGADVPEALAEEVMAFSRQVGDEDALLVASVQRGLASAMVPEGRLMPRSERLIAHFQGLVREALADKAV
jgi:phenylpropionate dioxygenase-like ring-hydroxylating dioxygenase large terminal subunit